MLPIWVILAMLMASGLVALDTGTVDTSREKVAGWLPETARVRHFLSGMGGGGPGR